MSGDPITTVIAIIGGLSGLFAVLGALAWIFDGHAPRHRPAVLRRMAALGSAHDHAHDDSDRTRGAREVC